MTEALNPEPLLRALHKAGVRHVIIGGFAVNAHAKDPMVGEHVRTMHGSPISRWPGRVGHRGSWMG